MGWKLMGWLARIHEIPFALKNGTSHPVPFTWLMMHSQMVCYWTAFPRKKVPVSAITGAVG